MRQRFLALAPILIGVLIGVWAQYISYGIVALVYGIFLAVGLGGYRVGRRLLPKWPKMAIWIYQVGVALPVLVVATVSMFTTWLALNLEPLLSGSGDPELAADAKVVSGVLIGAIGAFLAGMWLDEAEDPKSRLWPAMNVRKGFAEVFGKVPENLTGDDRINVTDAVFGFRVARGDIRGWGVDALQSRLDIILAHCDP